MKTDPPSWVAYSCLPDARGAARDIYAQLQPSSGSLVLLFCSSLYDLNALADEINLEFTNQKVIGCTTAGEISPNGYQNSGICAICLPENLFTTMTGRLDNLSDFHADIGFDFARTLQRQLESLEPEATTSNTFGFLLTDGLSAREEAVARTFQNALGSIPLVGGSAGDDWQYKRTWIFHEGQFHTDSTLLLLATTQLPFHAFMTYHFQPGNEALTVTKADPKSRTVFQLNGLPATHEYARLLGVDPEKLSANYFAASPVITSIDGINYVRSIQKSNPDESLTFHCAIEEGMKLRASGSIGLIETVRNTFREIQNKS